MQHLVRQQNEMAECVTVMWRFLKQVISRPTVTEALPFNLSIGTRGATHEDTISSANGILLLYCLHDYL